MKTAIYDCEVLPNLFLTCFKDKDSDEKKEFLIYDKFNDFEEYIKFVKSLQGQIGYNCINYDAQIQQYLLNNYRTLQYLSSKELTNAIYQYSNYIIDKSKNNQFADFAEWNLSIKQLDLMKVWHFDNKNKMTSLKWLQFSIDWNDLREMNIKFNEEINDEQLDELVYYCWNDVLSTEAIYKITKGNTKLELYKNKDKIQFRVDIQNKFGYKNCINWNDVKIGNELNFINYTKETNETKEDIFNKKVIDKEIELKKCIPEYIEFKTDILKNLLEEIKQTIITVKKEGDEKTKFKKEIKIGETNYVIMLGGLHSVDLPRRIKIEDNELMIDADVGGQYPSALAKRKLYPKHLNKLWCETIESNILERDRLKPQSKTNGKIAAICEALKLCNNGGAYGKLGEITNWQCDFEILYSVTIGCQLEILMLIEELEINNIKVISGNTDGIISLLLLEQAELYHKICNEWEKKVNAIDYGKLEFTNYKELIQLSVNDYLAIKVNGEIKKKGDFTTEFELHRNKSKRIIPLALEQYYLNNIPIEDSINNHKNIYDYCSCVRMTRNDKLFLLNLKEYTETQQQKTVRYYISNSNDVLIKKMKKLDYKKASFQIDLFTNEVDIGTRKNQIEAGYKVTIFNEFEEKENYNIDYQHYIKKCQEIIDKIK